MDKDWDRKWFKKLFARDVLGKAALPNGEQYQSPVEDLFRILFPTIWWFIYEFNDHGRQHSNLIRVLQCLESRLVIGKAAIGVQGERSVISLHDSIYASLGGVEDVEAAIDGAFKELGFKIRYERTG